tara:strand:+ start:1023 stop:1355 length:333 start_codon:yes stop_codon:yes gene_type:complete
MKITRGDIRSIIREMLIKEDRADRLTLWLKVEGDELVLHVNESGMVYDLVDYTNPVKQKGGLYGLMRDFEADHGMEMPEGAMVIDYDGVGMGDLPIEQAWEWVAAEYANM